MCIRTCIKASVRTYCIKVYVLKQKILNMLCRITDDAIV